LASLVADCGSKVLTGDDSALPSLGSFVVDAVAEPAENNSVAVEVTEIAGTLEEVVDEDAGSLALEFSVAGDSAPNTLAAIAAPFACACTAVVFSPVDTSESAIC
jgi:hypothetical protein